MFTRIQARHFRSLKLIDQRLAPFQALVGANASGKTTFLDTLVLLSDMMRLRGDVPEAVHKRGADFTKLLWKGEGSSLQLAVEAVIPHDVREQMAKEKQRFSTVRYEAEIGLDSGSNEIGLNHETLWLIEDEKLKLRYGVDLEELDDDTCTVVENERTSQPSGRQSFPKAREDVATLFLRPSRKRNVAIRKNPGGNDNYYTEVTKKYQPSFRLNAVPPWRTFLRIWAAFLSVFGFGRCSRTVPRTSSSIARSSDNPARRPRQAVPDEWLQPPWVTNELRKDEKRFSMWLDQGVDRVGRHSRHSHGGTKKTDTAIWSSTTRTAPACLRGWSRTGRCGCSP